MIVGEVFLAILFGYDGDESEVVAPHKKSQVVIVAMSKEGAMRQGLVEGRRGGLRGFLVAIRVDGVCAVGRPGGCRGVGGQCGGNVDGDRAREPSEVGIASGKASDRAGGMA